MKRYLCFCMVLAAFILCEPAVAAPVSGSREGVGRSSASGPAPTYADVAYGQHPRNALDLWIAESDKPTPLVIYIHGGGFIGGDKSSIRQKGNANLARCLDHGVSFAAINYPFRSDMNLHAIMLHIARAAQFLRYNAKRYNLDKVRFAAFGGSAGGGASIWLAFHDDLADPDNPDPVLRESSRLATAGHLNSQATYDCEKWAEIIGIPSTWDRDMRGRQERGFNEDLEFYGIREREDVNKPETVEIRKQLDMISFINAGDPPVYTHNMAPNTNPVKAGEVIHHPRHSIRLKKVCDKAGVECALVTRDVPQSERVDMLDFFFKHLKVGRDGSPVK